MITNFESNGLTSKFFGTVRISLQCTGFTPLTLFLVSLPYLSPLLNYASRHYVLIHVGLDMLGTSYIAPLSEMELWP